MVLPLLLPLLQIGFLALSLALGGCSDMPLGDEEALVNGRLTEGAIQGNRYVAELPSGFAHNKVSVFLPPSEDKYEFSHMWRWDERDFKKIEAVFGPSALDGMVYHLEVENDAQNLEQFYNRALLPAMEKARRNHGADLEKMHFAPTTIKGRKALFGLYKQVYRDPNSNNLMPQYYTAMYTHAFYAIDFGKDKAFVWVQGTSQCGVNPVEAIEQKQWLRQAFTPVNQFVQSVELF